MYSGEPAVLEGMVADSLPLAPSQEVHWESMCATSPADPGASRIIVGETRRADGPLDRDLLDQALAWVVRRHDALRLTFETVSLDPRLQVRPEMAHALDYVDVSSDDAGTVGRTLFLHSRRPYDLPNGPLWRALLLRLSDNRHLLRVGMSHLIADGYSTEVFFTDLFRAYAALRDQGRPTGPRAPTVPEIHAVQRATYRPASERPEYWRRLIPTHSFPPAFTLCPVPGEIDYLHDRLIELSLSQSTARALARTAWRVRATPFAALMAAYHIVLQAMTGKGRTVVATVALGRDRAADRLAIFQYAAYPYVSMAASDHDTLAQVVGATGQALSDALRQRVPYVGLARTINPDFDRVRPWPAANFIDGGMYSWAPDGRDIHLDGLTVRPVEVAPVAPPGYASEFTSSSFPQGHPPAWVAHAAPSYAVSTDRRQVIARYNDLLVSTLEVEAFCEGLRWVVEQTAHRCGLPLSEARRSLMSILSVGRDGGR